MLGSAFFVHVDENQRIVAVSNKFTATTGYDRVVGEPVSKVLPWSASQQTSAKDRVCSREYGKGMTKTGVQYYVDMVTEPLGETGTTMILCVPVSVRDRHAKLSISTSFNEIHSPLYRDRMERMAGIVSQRGAQSAPTSRRPPPHPRPPSSYAMPSAKVVTKG